MFVARAGDFLVEAERDLDRTADYRCPVCGRPAVLKPSRVKVAHFAHAAGADCPASGHEGPDHLAAKRILSQRFRDLGYTVRAEETFGWERRVDLAVAMPDGCCIAVELQDNPIPVDEMKQRMRVDQDNGFVATLWVWIGRREQQLRQAEMDGEGRIANEVRWLANRMHVGVFALPIDYDDLADGVVEPLLPRRYTFDDVYREGHEASWFESGVEVGVSYADWTLRATKQAGSEPCGFDMYVIPGRYHSPRKADWTVALGKRLPRRSWDPPRSEDRDEPTGFWEQ
ncbi:competence protein CoiA family protein [Micromonospora zamorensis]|uniref:competence protein CoiA family protein n=1 Tax=Micromonospora zamorensis TaxID=709883 RepID=UPI002E2B6362|nr:competence protein CoiA family protein [Micromonospora zamorensis]